MERGSRHILRVLHIAKSTSVMARLFNHTMVNSQKIILEETGKRNPNLLSFPAVACFKLCLWLKKPPDRPNLSFFSFLLKRITDKIAVGCLPEFPRRSLSDYAYDSLSDPWAGEGRAS